MLETGLTLQQRIDTFLERKYEELPELEKSADSMYRDLSREVRQEEQRSFSKVGFGRSVRERTIPSARRIRHYGGLHMAA